MRTPTDSLPPLPGGATGGPVTLGRDALTTWGEALGRTLAPGALVTIAGDLGAGKTTLVQAICRGYGVEEAVTSPTFALVHSYHAPRSDVHHFDLYRLRDARDLLQIGWDELLDSGGLSLVEWPERAAGALPAGAVAITLAHAAAGDDVRTVTVR